MWAAGVVLLAGCGSEVQGTAQVAERWDPCSVTPESIEVAGLDPSYRDEGWGEGIVVSDWSRCAFRSAVENPSYFFSIKSSDSHTVEEAMQSPKNQNGKVLDINGRDAFSYGTSVAETSESCNIAVEVQTGVVVFTVSPMGSTDVDLDLCGLVMKHTSDLEDQLPSQ